MLTWNCLDGNHAYVSAAIVAAEFPQVTLEIGETLRRFAQKRGQLRGGRWAGGGVAPRGVLISPVSNRRGVFASGQWRGIGEHQSVVISLNKTVSSSNID